MHSLIHIPPTNNEKQTVSRETPRLDQVKENYTDVIHNVDNSVYAALPGSISETSQLT